MIAFAFLFIPVVYILVRSLDRERRDEAGFLLALAGGLVHALIALVAGDIFNRADGLWYGIVNTAFERTLFPVLLPAIIWLVMHHFFSKSMSLWFDQFVLVYLVLPALVGAIDALNPGWPVDLVVTPALQGLLVLALSRLLRFTASSRSWRLVLAWTGVVLLPLFTVTAASAAWLYRPLLALLCALPVLVGARASIVMDIRSRA
jgi:hypothetical protein